jgi:general secretion pathway protein G
MRLNTNKGFTLIEVIVVAGIIAVLAGILVPLIFKEIDESKSARAKADVRSISSALIVLKKDTGQWPINAGCTPAVTLLHGSGPNGAILPTINAGIGWDTTSPNTYMNYISTDDNGCWPATWKGPYIAWVNADPWGREYITNADQFLAAAGPIWILSAGPDGIVDTNATADIVANDDEGLRLR